MRLSDLLREALRALRANPSRTILTALGITAGTVALTLILSISLGLEHVIDDLIASDEQLRQVLVMPGFGRQSSDGFSVPEVAGEMEAEKRRRLQRSLLKRSRGGPPFQVRSHVIDAATERELAAHPAVASSRAFLQERFDVAVVDAPEGLRAAPALSLGVRADTTYYPPRVLAGRWFATDDEPGVVVHEVLLWKMGATSDAAQAALIGKTLRLTARKGPAGLMGMLVGAGASTSTAAVVYEIDVPLLGVLRERYGEDRANFVEEAWSMQTDLFLAQGFARTLWDRQPERGGPQALLLIAKSLEHVAEIDEYADRRGLEARTIKEGVEGLKKSLSIVTIVATALAGIAVVVAALGIVNTLVMSVLERTREIGLLKALGATDADVARLFLVEAGVLGFLGGVAGVGFGYALSLVGDAFGRAKIEEVFLLPFQGSLFRFPWWLAGGALAFALVTSLLAAIVPTLRASRVDPVRALRHE